MNNSKFKIKHSKLILFAFSVIDIELLEKLK